MHKKLKDVHTYEGYVSLPKEERTTKKWFWFGDWYVLPFALRWDLKSFRNDEPSDWTKTYSFLKENYPIQYFFRNLDEYPPFVQIGRWKYSFVHTYWFSIRDFFRPRNRDLRNCIPNTWKDEGEILKDICDKIFLRVYLPHKFDNWRTDEYTDHWPRLAKEADEIYTKIQLREKLKVEMENAWKEVDLKDDSNYDAKYGKVNELENKIYENDSEIMTWIVKNRNILDR